MISIAVIDMMYKNTFVGVFHLFLLGTAALKKCCICMNDSSIKFFIYSKVEHLFETPHSGAQSVSLQLQGFIPHKP